MNLQTTYYQLVITENRLFYFKRLFDNFSGDYIYENL